MNRIAIISVILSSILMSACSEEFEPKPLTYTQLLTGPNKKSWRAIGLQIREDGKSVANLEAPQFLPPCVYDDLYVFYANDERLLQVDEGGAKCNSEDPQIFLESNWSFVNANATLEMIIPWLAPFPLPFVVQKLTENELQVEIWLDLENTESYRIIFTEIDTE